MKVKYSRTRVTFYDKAVRQGELLTINFFDTPTKKEIKEKLAGMGYCKPMILDVERERNIEGVIDDDLFNEFDLFNENLEG